MSVINPGDRLFHYDPNTKKITGCTVEAIIDKNIIVMLDRVFIRKTKLTLPLTCFGERLFYEKDHISLPFDELAEIEAYYKFENPNIEIVLPETIKIKKILEKRRISNLVHFTRLDNLRSILERGLVPRKNHRSLNIEASYNDMDRFDNKLDATSCSITFPNDKIFRKFRDDYPNEKWVIVILDAEVILSKEVKCVFCLTNAANKAMRSQNGSELQHFQNMFDDEITVEKRDGSSTTCVRGHIPDNFTTDVQAEVLIAGNIEKKYIQKIVFNNHSTRDEWYSNNIDVAKDFCLDTIPEYFGWRNNFRG